MIRHIVALRFRATVTSEVKLALFRDLAELGKHIEGILDFRHFDNVSVETQLVRGFKDVFWFDFRDEKVRDVYLVDPVHRAIGSRIVSELDGGAEGVFVADVEL